MPTRQRVYASENEKSYSINSGFPFLPASGGVGAETDRKIRVYMVPALADRGFFERRGLQRRYQGKG